MKKMNKLMAIGLSLVLCLGMIAPVFADDAYFYGKLDNDQIEQIQATDPDFDQYRPANDPNNGGWVFLGKGDTGDITSEDATSVVVTDKDGKTDLAEGVIAPKADENSEDGTQTVHTTQVGDVTVKPFHDLGEYKYDDGAEDTEVGQYSYTVEWTESKKVSTGATLKGTETTDKTDAGKIVISGSNTINVDGKIELHENQKAEVTIADYGKDDVKGESEQFVRQTAELTSREAADALAGALTSAITASGATAEQLNETNYTIVENKDQDTGKVTKTYTEKTYTVTINANTDLGFAGVGATTYGKAHGHGEVDALANRYVPGVGTYTFTDWTAETDAEGNVTYTANVTFSPEYYYYDLPEVEIEVDDPAVPLAAGPVTRAEFIDYLWRHEGEPDSEGVCTFTDVEDTHEYFDALCWAEENGVAAAYFDAEDHEDGTFEPDELVTVGAVREFLDNFADVFGTNAVAAADLTTLTGEDGEAVLNCDQVLAEFFGEEYELPEDLDALEPDTAA